MLYIIMCNIYIYFIYIYILLIVSISTLKYVSKNIIHDP